MKLILKLLIYIVGLNIIATTFFKTITDEYIKLNSTPEVINSKKNE